MGGGASPRGWSLLGFLLRGLLLANLPHVSCGAREGPLEEVRTLTDTLVELMDFGKTRAETHLYLNYSVPSTEIKARWSRCNMPVVSAAEAEKFISEMGAIPGDHQHGARPSRVFLSKAARDEAGTYKDAGRSLDFDFSSHDVEVSYQTELTMRFAMLSYSRWHKVKGALLAVYTNNETGQEEIIEIELSDGAHGVLYMYRLSGGGVGVVLTIKGSGYSLDYATLRDWITNVRATLSADRGSALQGEVHNGYNNYRKRILELMGKTSLTGIRHLLQEWSGKKVEEGNLKDWLYNGDNWKWAFFTGHSMGAGVAQIEAVTLATELGITEADRRVFLGHVASPKIATEEFVRYASQRVSPHGGLNVDKMVDVVTHIGSGRGLATGMRVSVAPSGMTWSEEHAYFHIPATVGGERGIVELSSACTGSECSSACGCSADVWASDRERYGVRTGRLPEAVHKADSVPVIARESGRDLWVHNDFTKLFLESNGYASLTEEFPKKLASVAESVKRIVDSVGVEVDGRALYDKYKEQLFSTSKLAAGLLGRAASRVPAKPIGVAAVVPRGRTSLPERVSAPRARKQGQLVIDNARKTKYMRHQKEVLSALRRLFSIL